MAVMPSPNIPLLLRIFPALSISHKSLLAALWIYNQPLGKARCLDYFKACGLRTEEGLVYTGDRVAEAIKALTEKEFLVSRSVGCGVASDPTLGNEILRFSLKSGIFNELYEASVKFRLSLDRWQGTYVQDEGHALSGLRAALFAGKPPIEVARWLESAVEFMDEHPYLVLFSNSFDAELFAYIHPVMQASILAFSFSYFGMDRYPAKTVQEMRVYAVREGQPKSGVLAKAVAFDAILMGVMGQLDNIGLEEGAPINALLGLTRETTPLENSLIHFEEALKSYRKSTGKRAITFRGIMGYSYVLAFLRSKEPKHQKSLETYLQQSIKQASSYEEEKIFELFEVFQRIQSGLAPKELFRVEIIDRFASVIIQFFVAMIAYWLDANQLKNKKSKAVLVDVLQRALEKNFYWIAAQLAQVLYQLGEREYGSQAEALRNKYGFANVLTWFERQEDWQRQLAALIQLSPETGSTKAAAASSTADVLRMVWMVRYHEYHACLEFSLRERKCNARGEWTKGRAIALKRASEHPEEFPYATDQDRKAIQTIEKQYYYGGSQYVSHPEKTSLALVGHPYVFWDDAPDTRVELIHAEPELVVKKQNKFLIISLHPAIKGDSGTSLLVEKETPTRLRLVQINEPHRRIAQILGDEKLVVPLEAEQQVLQAIASMAPLMTVHSDVGGVHANLERREADPRIHALLLPVQQGLKMQLRVRPLSAGTYYVPGKGAESVITEVEGVAVQAQRDLKAEARAAKQVIAQCPILEQAIFEHEEWQLDETELCLELLLQLQAQGETLLVSWPEGEKFKLAGARVDGKQFSLAIKNDQNWFAVQGELRLDENRVLDLQRLLELVRQSPGRFIALGNQEFLALTDAFQRRLSELAAFSEIKGDDVVVHPLAAFALEDLSQEAGDLKADQHWKSHLTKLEAIDKVTPQIPSTLQAELRDYQMEGFRWLSRLAEWGVGACLADDMGLGKTIQILALMLARASQGATLVVAPTSVCTNWLSEVARFAPSLNTVMFGGGNREDTLANLQPFDVVITTYGLLQQASEAFSQIEWHTVVLDEAQAIKNANTLRSKSVMKLKAQFRVIATGTPLENHLGELWNLFQFINPGLLGSMDRFNERFALPIERQKDSQARHRLRRLIQPFILRRTKAQVLTELPSRTEIIRRVDLSKEEKELYEALRRSAVERLAGLDAAEQGKQAIQILAEMMKLRRVCCNPNLVAPELSLVSSKLEVFAELLEELLSNHHKALVFSQFVDHLSLIRAYLDEKKIYYHYLDGSTPMQERKKRVDAFQAGEGDVFLISLKAGGTGLNLTAADYVIHMDPWWNPAVEDQASDRAHRMGQLRPVTIYRLVAKQTIEESIIKLHEHKRDLADSLLEGSDVSSRLSAKEMIALLQEEF